MGEGAGGGWRVVRAGEGGEGRGQCLALLCGRRKAQQSHFTVLEPSRGLTSPAPGTAPALPHNLHPPLAPAPPSIQSLPGGRREAASRFPRDLDCGSLSSRLILLLGVRGRPGACVSTTAMCPAVHTKDKRCTLSRIRVCKCCLLCLDYPSSPPTIPHPGPFAFT